MVITSMDDHDVMEGQLISVHDQLAGKGRVTFNAVVDNVVEGLEKKNSRRGRKTIKSSILLRSIRLLLPPTKNLVRDITELLNAGESNCRDEIGGCSI